MNTNEEAANILKEFNVIFDSNARFSQVGGLEPFMVFLRKGKFLERWESQFGTYRARTMLQFILGLVAGARCMNDIGKIAKDPAIRKFLKNPVEEAQLGRDVRSFNCQMIEDLHELVISYSILDFTKSIPHSERLVFDVDATSVEKYGEQEGVEAGYIAKDIIESCYQYLFFRLHNRNHFLYGTIRAGSTHSQNDFCGYLMRFLPWLKNRWQSSWRCDAGYFNEAAFDVFSENDALFFIKAPMVSSRNTMVMMSPDVHWTEEVGGVSYFSRLTNTAKGTMYREVFKRTLIPHKYGQMSFFDLENYRYDCIATNDLSTSEEEVFLFYNGRANIENNIKELKQDYQLGKIVTESFNANDVITQLTMLTYMLVRHFQSEVLPEKMQRMQLSTLRNHVFNIPGRILFMQRKIWIRIQNLFLDQFTYAEIFTNLKKLKSWILEPPDLSVS